jgi:hypothetical protein
MQKIKEKIDTRRQHGNLGKELRNKQNRLPSPAWTMTVKPD